MFDHPVKSAKKDVKIPKKWDISSIPEQDFELRVIIWETNNVPSADATGTSDVFVRVSLNNLDIPQVEETDVHTQATRGFVRKNQAKSNFLDYSLIDLINTFRPRSTGGCSFQSKLINTHQHQK